MAAIEHGRAGSSEADARSRQWKSALGLITLYLAEFALIDQVFQLRDPIGCRDLATPGLCDFMSDIPLRVVAIAGATMVALFARAEAARALASGLRARIAAPWLLLHLVGVAAVLAQAAFLTDDLTRAGFAVVAGALIVGGLAALIGGAFAVAPAWSWIYAAHRLGLLAWAGVALAATLPDLLGAGLRHAAGAVWRVNALAQVTLDAVHGLLLALGQSVSRPQTGSASVASDFVIGIDGFAVEVGGPCSGVEGFGLIAAFIIFYMLLFWRDLRFPHALLLLPLAIGASWALNVIRIAALIAIGAHLSPKLAVNGFHSHAGWMMFTLLALVAIGASRTVHCFRARVAEISLPAIAASPPFWRDPVAARIFPFVVFMATALAASTFVEQPALVYPLRALATAAALAGFFCVLRDMSWRIDPLALAVGLAIGVGWVASAPGGDAGDAALSAALAQLPFWLLAIWVGARLIGTTLLVPLVEELFFRGYVLRRLDMGGPAMRVLAVAVSTGLFAALHDRWIAAGLAGLAFALLALRRRDGLVDAVLAHAVANALIAAWALRTGDWSLI